MKTSCHTRASPMPKVWNQIPKNDRRALFKDLQRKTIVLPFDCLMLNAYPDLGSLVSLHVSSQKTKFTVLCRFCIGIVLGIHVVQEPRSHPVTQKLNYCVGHRIVDCHVPAQPEVIFKVSTCSKYYVVSMSILTHFHSTAQCFKAQGRWVRHKNSRRQSCECNECRTKSIHV